MSKKAIDFLAGYSAEDTIAAIATYPAKSALGIIKISGETACLILSKIFLPKRKKNILSAGTYSLHYGWIRDEGRKKIRKSKRKNKEDILPCASDIVDEVIVSIMKKPSTYTREDIVEISSHGGILVLEKILKLIISHGARLAQPGEFTYRAFINGRLDLLQAQAVLEIVEAQTEGALKAAFSQVKGEFSGKLDHLRQELTGILAVMEAWTQFPEQEIEVSIPGLEEKIEKAAQSIDEIIISAKRGEVLKGIKCVICGKANTGKSTLFNRLFKKERVIVTEIEGTTRDIVEEQVVIKGIPFNLCDTAGLLDPKDVIEEKALKNTFALVDEADVIVLLLDYSREADRRDIRLVERLKSKGNKTLIVVNKIDLQKKLDTGVFRNSLPGGSVLRISAVTGRGIEKLEEKLAGAVNSKNLSATEEQSAVFLMQGQKRILEEASVHLKQARDYIKEGYSLDFLLFSVKEAVRVLEKLFGNSFGRDCLREVFSRFCVGK